MDDLKLDDIENLDEVLEVTNQDVDVANYLKHSEDRKVNVYIKANTAKRKVDVDLNIVNRKEKVQETNSKVLAAYLDEEVGQTRDSIENDNIKIIDD